MNRTPPQSWEIVSLDDIADINPRKFDANDLLEVTFLPMKAVEEISGRIDASETRLFGEVKKGYTHFKEEDILFAKITPCMENGKVAVAKNLKNDLGCGSTEFYVIRMKSEELNPQFYFHFVLQDRFRHEAQHHMTGAVGQKRVPKSFMQNAPVPLSPTKEQERIVAKIEELFPRLDKGVEALATAKKQLARYRAAVLKAAFSGKLTEEWRKKHGDGGEPAVALFQRILKERKSAWSQKRYREHPSVDTSELPSIPSTWIWAALGGLCDVKLGKMLSRKAYEPSLRQLRYLRNENVRWGNVNYTDMKMMGFKPDEIERYSVRKGDLLVCEGGEPGRCAVVTTEGDGRMYQKALHRVRPYGAIIRSSFIQLCMRYYKSCNTVIPRTSETTIKHLPLEKMMALPIPLPPLSEQNLLLAEVERHDSIADAIEKTIDNGLKEAGRLRQSILKKAFEGRLVPQDPNDEPASELLKRIQSEQNEAKPVKKTRKKKAQRRKVKR